jgi:peroxiredoxin
MVTMLLNRALSLAIVLLASQALAGSAPGFDAWSLDGTRYTLSSLSGKIVVLNFWFKNCGACRSEREALNRVVERYRSAPDVVFIGFSTDEETELREYLRQNPFRYAVIADSSEIASAYAVKSFPTHVIIDRKGQIVQRWSDATAAFERLTQAIDAVRPAQTASQRMDTASAGPQQRGPTQEQRLLVSPPQPTRRSTMRVFYEPNVGALLSEFSIVWDAYAGATVVRASAPMRQQGELVMYEMNVPSDATQLRLRIFFREAEVAARTIQIAAPGRSPAGAVASPTD